MNDQHSLLYILTALLSRQFCLVCLPACINVFYLIYSCKLIRHCQQSYYHSIFTNCPIKPAMSAGEHARWGYANCFQLSKFCRFERVTFSVTSKAPKFTETSTSELGFNKGHFDRITERCFSGYARSRSLNFFIKNKSVKTILLVVLK